LQLNREAIDGLDAYAGNFRPGPVDIEKSRHAPPGAHQVAEFVEELCDYINNNFKEKNAIHLASMVMWRMNWIHPFTDGNGRTSRATAYTILCARIGHLLPGAKTIPEQIVANRTPYYDALEAADAIYEQEGELTENTVHAMEELLGGMLATQLLDALEEATGNGEGS